MKKILIVLSLLLTLGFANAQEDPVFDFSNAEVYCRVQVQSTDTDRVTGLCIQALNLFEAFGTRVSFALEERFPSLAITPLLMVDYASEDWFAGFELGYAFEDTSALRVALSFGANGRFLNPQSDKNSF